MTLLIFAVAVAAASDPNLPHYHRGKLSQYEIGPPSIRLSADDEDKLRRGETLQQAMVQEDGIARRLLMVKDIPAPPDVVAGRIIDIDAYPRMVKGCDRTSSYETSSISGVRTIKTRYDIHALHMKFTYYMVHMWDPAKRCMTFQLDYDRRSDIDDSVGYWFVQPKGPEVRARSSILFNTLPKPFCVCVAISLLQECRVYYSCVTKLRTWVPGPVYKLLTSAALRQATTWVDTESVKEWSAVKARREAFAKPQQFILKMREKADAARKRMQMPRSQAQPVSAKWPFRRRAEAATIFLCGG